MDLQVTVFLTADEAHSLVDRAVRTQNSLPDSFELPVPPRFLSVRVTQHTRRARRSFAMRVNGLLRSLTVASEPNGWGSCSQHLSGDDFFPALLQDNELFFFTNAAGMHFFSARSRKRVILFLSHGLKISITTQKWRQSRCSLWACCVIKIYSRKHELERWKNADVMLARFGRRSRRPAMAKHDGADRVVYKKRFAGRTGRSLTEWNTPLDTRRSVAHSGRSLGDNNKSDAIHNVSEC
ncbi:uncharacterized protein LOC118807978 isoform X2 [Colossoma macropomum]|uniref:uncharacterized protein LOC118807978 isoform X2 n=1 Tax=Colossoma macropomum TaxID=42526 RepID=UPI001864379C|nr:uncharacterized protein LOC118807978 isoform X2 [Colossoma macropomum]